MSTFSHDNRQWILNRAYDLIKGERAPKSIISFFDRYGCLDGYWAFSTTNFHNPDDADFIDKLRAGPELANFLFPMDGNDELDNDDFAFLIDLENEHRTAITHARDHFDATHRLDTASFRDDLRQRLDRIAANEGLERPTAALLSAWR